MLALILLNSGGVVMKRIFITLFALYMLSFTSTCFAYEGKQLCNMGAEKLYYSIINTSYIHNRIPSSAFGRLYSGNGDSYFFNYVDSKFPQVKLKTSISYNQAGYVTMVSILGSHVDNIQMMSLAGMCVGVLYTLGLTQSECTYIFNHFELADALYTADGSPGELYTSQVFSLLSGKTIGVLSNVYKNGATIVSIVAL